MKNHQGIAWGLRILGCAALCLAYGTAQATGTTSGAPGTTTGGGTTQNGCWVNAAVQSAVKNNAAIAASQAASGNTIQSSGALDQCLSQIQNLGSVFNFAIPTNLFSSLLGQACTMGTSYINTETNKYVNTNVQYPGVQVYAGTGQNGVNYTTNNDSSTVANQIWNSAVGPNNGG